MLALVALTGFLFSSSSGATAASRCTSARTEPGLKLVLSNESPTPRVRGRVGVTVKVVSSYHDGQMTFPTARPSNAVCEVSRDRSRDGTATVIYKALRKATVRFFSNYTHETDAKDPAMMGRLVVR